MIDLKAVIENLPSAIVVVDRERRVLLSNWVAQEFSGLGESQIVDKRSGEVLDCRHADETVLGCGFGAHCQRCELKSAIEKAFQDRGHIKPFETEMDIRNIGVRSFKITISYLTDILSHGQAGVLVTIDDVTDFKLKERLAAANETIGAVCHEMNQPLMALMGNIELLMMDASEVALLPEILAQSQRLGQITKKMQSLTGYVTKRYLSAESRILDLEGAAKI